MAAESLADKKLFLFDLDGVFRAGKESQRKIAGDRIIPALRQREIPFRIVTNTTTHTTERLARDLRDLGLDVKREEIHSALEAVLGYLGERGIRRCFLVGEKGFSEALAASGLELDEHGAEAVIVALDRFGAFEKLSGAMRAILAGARLIAAHRSRIYNDGTQNMISAGPLVAALEFATGAKAEIIGKPNPTFFRTMLNRLDTEPRDAVMVGDSLTNDISGAKEAGIASVLVLSGKTSQADIKKSPIAPDIVLPTADDLVNFL